MLTILEDVPQPSPLGVVATWRTGVGLELSEDIVALACEVLYEYGEQMGEAMVSLMIPSLEQQTA
ncbi:hypothetical protein D9M68_758500 [compost metagenome]